MIDCIPQADVMGIWMLPFEDYYLNKYGNDNLKTTYLLDLEPWSSPEEPWSAALKGKKVLVIHPFKETIEQQYQRREKIFPGTNILPEFELKTLKAVQTVAGEKDVRFPTWFDALEWMYQEAMKIDFDVAIIGCGKKMMHLHMFRSFSMMHGYIHQMKISQKRQQKLKMGVIGKNFIH